MRRYPAMGEDQRKPRLLRRVPPALEDEFGAQQFKMAPTARLWVTRLVAVRMPSGKCPVLSIRPFSFAFGIRSKCCQTKGTLTASGL